MLLNKIEHGVWLFHLSRQILFLAYGFLTGSSIKEVDYLILLISKQFAIKNFFFGDRGYPHRLHVAAVSKIVCHQFTSPD